MKTIGNVKIIGVDAGYGNMKTANFCFPTGPAVFDSEPIFNSGMLVYNDRYYLIGEGHRRFTPDKTMDEDYYVLTLAAIGLELRKENLTEADVFIAAGLPLTWVSGQKAGYREYLLQKQEVTFTFMQEAYHVHIVGAEVFPQGFSAIAENAADLKGITLLCDIGNGTMNLLYLQNGFDIFVNAVYVYDDKIVFTYNFKDGCQTMTLQEIEAALGSDLELLAPPSKSTIHIGWCFLFC